jgi:hypothetical protein
LGPFSSLQRLFKRPLEIFPFISGSAAVENKFQHTAPDRSKRQISPSKAASLPDMSAASEAGQTVGGLATNGTEPHIDWGFRGVNKHLAFGTLYASLWLALEKDL